MKLFSYKLTHDTGFAPNPFRGFLTIATCKPGIRRSKCPGAWIAGFTSRALCGDRIGEERLIFIVKISEKCSLAEYFNDPRFSNKKPNQVLSKQVCRVGDNIYRPLRLKPMTESDFEQLPNPYHNYANKARDISGKSVLIGTEFVYFGRNAIQVPPDLRPRLPVGQSAYGVATPDVEQALKFIEFTTWKTGKQRILGAPHSWPASDQSWME